MDPVSAVVLSLLASWYFGRNIYADSVYKARGEDPPSYRRQMERIARREERRARPVTDRQEARRFWANAWADAWASAEDKRERTHAKRRQERRRRWEAEDLAEAEDAAWERNQAMDEAETPDRPEGDRVVSATCLACLAHVPGQEITTVTIDGVLVRACARCAAAAAARTGEPQPGAHSPPPEPQPGPGDPGEGSGPQAGPVPDEPHQGAQPRADTDAGAQRTAQAGDPGDGPGGDPGGEAGGEAGRQTGPQGAPDSGPGARVIPLVPRPGGGRDGAPGGEVAGLPSALAYTATMAAIAGHGVTSVETTLASLTAAGVSGAAVEHLMRAAEALGQAAQAFTAAQQALEEHLGVAEAYTVNADAGSREFVRE